MKRLTMKSFFTALEIIVIFTYLKSIKIFSVTHKTQLTELNEAGVINLHLNLLPHKRFMQVYLKVKGYAYHKIINLCVSAKGCAKVCLETCGMNVFESAILAKFNKTQFYIEDIKLFIKVLIYNIHNTAIQHPDKLVLTRLNTLSDIIWENIPFIIDGTIYENIFDYFKSYDNVKFYDYTKIKNRNVKYISNYELIYSYNETDHIYDLPKLFLTFNNIAVVFRSKLPKKFEFYPVINGDESDYNIKYSKRIIGLLAKGKAIKDQSGFVQN